MDKSAKLYKGLLMTSTALTLAATVSVKDVQAGVSFPIELTENSVQNSIEYQLFNNTPSEFFGVPPLSIFAFAVGVDATGADPFASTHREAGRRAGWQAGVVEEFGDRLVFEEDWDSGIQLTDQLLPGGVSTSDLFSFNNFFDEDQVALFFDFDLGNLIGPGTSSAQGEFVIDLVGRLKLFCGNG